MAGSPAALPQVPDRGHQLPVEQRQRDRQHQQTAPRPEHQREHGAREQRPEPSDVAAERVRDQEHGQGQRRVQQRADPQRPVALWHQPDHRQGKQRDRDEGREAKRLAAPDRVGQVEDDRRDDAPERHPEPRPALAGERDRPAREGDEEASDRAREGGERRQRGRHGRAAMVDREQGGEPERHRGEERHPPGQQPQRDAGAEPEGRHEGRVAKAPAGELGEDCRRSDDGDRSGHADAEKGGDRRVEDAVGEQVVAGVPELVEALEPVALEELGPKGGRGEVLARRGPGQVGERQPRCEQGRCENGPAGPAGDWARRRRRATPSRTRPGSACPRAWSRRAARARASPADRGARRMRTAPGRGSR